MIGLVYQAYRGGVLLLPENRKRLAERITELDWTDGLSLGLLKEREQESYLNFVKNTPYKYYLTIMPMVYEIPEYVSNTDLYELIDEIRIKREEYENGCKVHK